MDNMKALAFAEAEMPLHDLNPRVASEIKTFARLMVNGSSEAAKILGVSLKRAFYGDKAEVKFDSASLDTPRERLWEITEDDFHNTLDDALERLSGDADGDVQQELVEAWRQRLERATLAIFDDTVPIDSFDELEPKNIVEGRKLLVFSLKGYGKIGADFFKALTLDPPEQKKKSSAKAKSKEDICQ